MKIGAVCEKYSEKLLGLPNVTGVGIGEKAGTPVIKVFVTRKVPVSSLRPQDVVPRVLQGHPTDVEEMGVPTALSGDNP